MSSLDIVDLITNNPITKLSDTHNNKFLEKVKKNFSDNEQQIFITSFYSYLNYHKTEDYIIDLDNIWKWLGFATKQKAILLLEKNFILNKHYKLLLNHEVKQNIIKINNCYNFGPEASGAKNKGSGGHNIQKYYLNIKTFKSLCLKAQTKKADEIHEYYIKLEELIQEVLEEEATEMKNKLLIKDNEISEKDNLLKNANQDKYKTIEKTLISKFPVNTECIYFGTIDNTNDKGEKLIKFGHSNNLPLRVQDHHKTYNNFILRDVFKVHNRQEIENTIKAYSKIKNHMRTIEINGKNKNEILAYDETYFTINRLSKYIKDIISEKTYSIENFNKLLEENSNLKKENEELFNTLTISEEKIKNYELDLNEKNELIEKLENSIKLLKEETVENIEKTVVYNNSLIEDNELNKKFNKFIDECCIIRNDVEVDSGDIIGQFRIWNGEKPKKLLFEEFNKYLRTRFLACRLQNQQKNQCVHGFKGVALKIINYKKKEINNITENFLFENCSFSPNHRAANSKLLEEYKNYKNKLNIEINNNEVKELKTYLNNCEYVLKGTVHLHNDNFTYEGYYGIGLNNDTNIRISKANSSKKVCKLDLETKSILNMWDSIAKAALEENISASKMSRSIKNEVKYDKYYYAISCE
tara:strand:- start:1969 stop:3888 length:1920 start_codon:yes stop_codon:yes gene_type:complete